MIVRFKFLRQLYLRVREDLARTHEFAYERVGFISARLGNLTSAEPLVLFTNYYPVPDDQYIDDRYSGARINSTAIREAMQCVLDSGEGLFHVHCHAHKGRPGFSSMDLDETPRIVSSLQVAGPTQAHGMVLLSNDRCITHVWMPGASKAIVADSVSVVGYPLEIWKSEKR
ncbi:MAG: hypothetical protein ACR2H4_03320 [Pyrinomonadaceae bacterium]